MEDVLAVNSDQSVQPEEGVTVPEAHFVPSASLVWWLSPEEAVVVFLLDKPIDITRDGR